MSAVAAGRLQHDAGSRGELPVVGDWVAVDVLNEKPPRAVIRAILPRFSKFARKEPGGRSIEQPIAANIDTALVVAGLDSDYSVARIERYVVLATEGRVEPVVLLTKADVCPNVESRAAEVRRALPDVDVHAVSVPAKIGLDGLERHLIPGRTLALLGSSGVGKSTLVNHLMGSGVQKTREVRVSDGKGRHTTTSRQLFTLPCGALMIDTPGMRELQLWASSEGLSAGFADVERLARWCRFADCRHTTEPGCAVVEALSEGRLDRRRFENYLKMRRELDHLEVKLAEGAARAERGRWKAIAREQKRIQRGRR